ncbi:MAG: hypothetical protein M3Q95_15085 [Bacteroidota bacterium]|nr:hypothetical protein [Bacteroidota bacterium]
MKNLISKLIIAASLFIAFGFIACDNKNGNDENNNELPTETLGTQEGENQRLDGTAGSDGIDNDNMSTGSGTGTNPANNSETGRNSGGEVVDSVNSSADTTTHNGSGMTGRPR